jgi:hypothetical protein
LKKEAATLALTRFTYHLLTPLNDSTNATEVVTATHLTVEEIRGRSIMIHAGGDNYSDTPKPLGRGGAGIAAERSIERYGA